MTDITLLDLFAGQALQGLCANPNGPFQSNGMCGWTRVSCNADIAEIVYELAAAMLLAKKDLAAAEQGKQEPQP